MLVVYLSSLVRAVIALHALVDNKAANGRAELEEKKGEEEKTKASKAKSDDDKEKDKEGGKSKTSDDKA